MDDTPRVVEFGHASSVRVVSRLVGKLDSVGSTPLILKLGSSSTLPDYPVDREDMNLGLREYVAGWT